VLGERPQAGPEAGGEHHGGEHTGIIANLAAPRAP
jgi:hypothetical protein